MIITESRVTSLTRFLAVQVVAIEYSPFLISLLSISAVSVQYFANSSY